MIADVSIFLIEVKYLLSIPVKTMGRQYKVTGVAQADTMRHMSDSLNIRMTIFKAFCEDSVSAIRPSHSRRKMYTTIFGSALKG